MPDCGFLEYSWRELVLRRFVNHGFWGRQQVLSATRSFGKKIVITRTANNRWEWESLGTARTRLQHGFAFSTAAKGPRISDRAPSSKRFASIPFSCHYPRCQKNEYRRYSSNRNCIQAFGYHEGATIRRYEIN